MMCFQEGTVSKESVIHDRGSKTFGEPLAFCEKSRKLVSSLAAYWRCSRLFVLPTNDTKLDLSLDLTLKYLGSLVSQIW